MADQDIPHGHGSSYKKGVSDGLFEQNQFEDDLPEGHHASYERGVTEGKALLKTIAERVRD